MMHRFGIGVVAAGALALAACGGDGGMMTGPSAMPRSGTALMSVAPMGGATAVSPAGSMTMRFSYAMGPGMEQLVDMHEGDVAGPVVPMTCAWSADRLVLTCTPQAPLKTRTLYTLHIGGGMRDASGQLIDMSQYGMSMGGQWAQPGMMGGMHAGMPWGMMGPGWQHQNGSYGMVFSFTTS